MTEADILFWAREYLRPYELELSSLLQQAGEALAVYALTANRWQTHCSLGLADVYWRLDLLELVLQLSEANIAAPLDFDLSLA